MREQIFDRIAMHDNSRAHLGDQYIHNYYGPVHQGAASVTPSTDKFLAGKRQKAHEGTATSAVRLQTCNGNVTGENARIQYGEQYCHFGQSIAFSATLPGGAPQRNTRDTIASLKFDEMDTRRTAIKAAYGDTCQWFFNTPEYKNWRDDSSLAEHHGFLWVRGKPGAGKSTLMRLAVKHVDQEFPHDVRMSFFFNAKGSCLERSVEGMYRSLLHQLLDQCPKLEQTIKQRAWNQITWPVGLLEEHFRNSVL